MFYINIIYIIIEPFILPYMLHHLILAKGSTIDTDQYSVKWPQYAGCEIQNLLMI